MTQRLHIHGLDVSKQLAELVALEIAPGTGIDPDHFWAGLAKALDEFIPQNRALLEKRRVLQQKIDEYYLEHQNTVDAHSPEKLTSFLQEIGYLVPDIRAKIATDHIDPEVSFVAGPQLVVPVMNARYAINAANARWGSLYDALYGTDIISDADGATKGLEYNPIRGQKVVEYVAAQLDMMLPLTVGSHAEVTEYKLEVPKDTDQPARLNILLASGETTQLQDPYAFIGYQENRVLLFKHHNLHIELHFDPLSLVGSLHPAGLKDVVLEAAMTTIQDCEDSVAAVDADDKLVVYRHWLGLMQGQLSEKIEKNGRVFERKLANDHFYKDVQGNTLQLSGRSLMLVRNVGLLMTTDAVLRDGEEIPEGILDGFMTAFAAVHDLQSLGKYKNSAAGSVYIVKPKMHGPEEVQFTVDLFNAIEQTLGFNKNTLKIGIMDEERRTTLNLGACIAAARERVIFINTGFLDRTGDEIHTAMEAGPVVRKTDMKAQPWISAYENWNVDHGLAAGMGQKAQIGKGMWPKPDLMAAMIETKAEHPKAGASCAWVPSPTAAVLHALHYHQVNVQTVQAELADRPFQSIEALLQVPLAKDTHWTASQIRAEIENNAQGILGYVARWIQQGIGCSKVPDIHDVGLMEDRATLRISSQHIANWLHHGVCTTEEVMQVMRRMASVVDRQNAEDKAYVPMGPHFETSLAFKAACALVFEGRTQPSGYTEPLLHRYRQEYKQQLKRQ